MTPDVISLLILLFVLIAFITRIIPVSIVALIGCALCVLTGLIEPNAIFSSFVSNGVTLVMGMMVVGAAMFHSGLAYRISHLFLKITGTTERGIVLATLLISTLMSAIMNNVGVVVTLMPIIMGMCRAAKVNYSRVLYPLACGSMMGGMLSLVGTTTNPIASNFLTDLGIPGFQFFDTAYIGLPLCIVGLAYFYFFGSKLLPNIVVDIQTEEEGEAFQENKRSMIICGIVVAAVVVVMAINPSWMPLHIAAIVGGLIMVLTKCVTEKQFWASLDWTTISMAGGMGVISGAVMSAGGGKLIANFVVDVLGEAPNPYVICTIIFLIVGIMTQFLSNVGAVSLMAPIGIFIAQGLNINPFAMTMIVAVAANASYMTPIGANAYTVIYEPGGYKFSDFLRPGLGLFLINMVLAIAIVPMVWSF
ncbi:SLC13 family permease [Hominifimenecus sp. rT4P-3]|uniref:SLC13 family permease n=1 Tax=Hominifimenecus sp. rT4P-3 TaxID=3242979 RepID=UPI003DA603D2